MRGFADGVGLVAAQRSQFVRALRFGLLVGLAALASAWSLAANSKSIAAGQNHTCSLTATGGVQCAGSNASGELGNGTTIASSTPVDVVGLGSGVIDVAAGGGVPNSEEFSCALTSAGAVKCWGGSATNGSANGELTPFNVPGLASGVVAITAGGTHACAITGGGGVKCWGINDSGQLGDGSSGNFSATPVDVQGLSSGVTAIAAGFTHTCAALAGGIKCWGANAQGQLGDSGTNGSPVPVDVSGVAFASGTISLAAGASHTCAVTNAGAAYCWGDNFRGQVGTFTGQDTNPVPVAVVGIGAAVQEVSTGDSFSCGLTTAGAVKCWGYSQDGQLGNGNHGYYEFSPLSVNGLDSGVREISSAAFGSHTCALLDTGAIKCWGRNDAGQFGSGSDSLRRTPTDVTGLSSGVSAVAADNFSSCALTNGGGVKCWGRNEFTGQLGDGTSTQNRFTPVDVTGLGSGVTAVSVGARHACALIANGVKCWGKNNLGQLGIGTFTNNAQTTPIDVTGLTSGVLAISAGDSHTCALKNTGGVKCWGLNGNGQVGDGTSGAGNNRSLPTDVVGLTSGVDAISSGYRHTCAVTTGGAVKCWGANNNGGLGNGTNVQSSTPVDVTGLSSGISTVATGTFHSCAKTTGGGIKCWGRNLFGELGNGTNVDSLVPIDVPGLASGISMLASGRGTNCVLTNTGGLKCWGGNGVGAVGDGTIGIRTAPVDVVGLTSGVASISEINLHVCAVTVGGGVKCWGQNLFGEIGDGTNFGITVPTDSLFSLTPAAAVALVQEPPLPVPDSSGSSGASVDAAPEIVVVGAPDSDADGVEAGQVFVYTPGDSPAAKAAFREATRAGKSVKAIADVNMATLQMPPELAGILDKLGGAVAVSHDGNTVAVGAPNQVSGRGRIYIFKKPPDGWTGKVLPSQEPLSAPNPVNGDGLGTSIAITNAGTIIAGAPGAASGAGVIFVIRKGDTTYTMSAPIGAKFPLPGDGFGSSVSGEGSDIAVGAPYRDVDGNADQGQVQVFREAGGVINPTPIAVVNNPVASPGDQFGASVSLSDGALLVGAPGRDRPAATDAGAAEVFEQTADPTTVTLVPSATLVDPTPEAGAALGTSVSLEGGTAIIGEPNADIGGNLDQGGALVFIAPLTTPFSGTPVPGGELFDPFGGAGDHYGTSVAAGGALTVVGVPGAGTQANKAAKALGGLAKAGEAIAYSDSVIFRSGMESLLSARDGCANPGLPIPDNDSAGVTNDFTLTGAIGNVKNLDVRVRITHGFVSDLRVSLIHVPSGRTLPLYAPKPGANCDSNDLEVEFDDQAVDGFARDQCGTGTPAIQGRFLPNDWLTIMQGVTRAGPWRLKVADVSPTDTGTLESWCVDAR